MSDSSDNPNVTAIMRRDVPVAAPGDSISTIARLLVDHRLPGLPVVENGEVIGIITEFDLIVRQADVEVPTPVPFLDAILVADAGPDFDDEVRRVLAVDARHLMSAPVVSVRSSATLSEVATLMVDRNVNLLPVLDEQLKLIGLVSRADLVRVISALENEDA